MNNIKPKKRLGQHFLRDKNIAARIAGSLTGEGYINVIEVGPGMGMLTQFLLQRNFPNFVAAEIDRESVTYLRERFGDDLSIIEKDFLRLDLESLFDGNFAITGNFPYNISSQIFFRAIEYRHKVREVTGMIQKEVAERIHSRPGSKQYGILSVLLQAWYSTEILFTVPPHLFFPMPKVNSAVIRLRRNKVERLDCDEDLFIRVVKSAFNQRRKTLRNALRARFSVQGIDDKVLSLRAEQLSVNSFAELTRIIEGNINHGKED
ncbi:MAG: 16S rRNA (adenine(1518)-N(6)/adenine(1519)-N(6))-dimethyltransferase RsmA [Bacteroidales bacterium]|jgi:16S rRNA (adenine1518-N6/adenine1519-N6)-dimethyltransferase|nr:16S rRNA (adenine(1518)-N(6)/adenine(1519)-N(6))-dimethyltransferase RsmA [Bacteroidales bacterium]